MKRLFILVTMITIGAIVNSSRACTGITLHSADGATITARTIEWAGNDLESRYSVVPRGYTQQSYVPGGLKEGMTFKAKYGYVGLAVEQEEFVVDGLNEAGLAAALFYFPDYGQYEDYDPASKSTTISDLQLVSWILSRFSTIDEVREAISGIHVVTIDPRGSTVHWRITEENGRQVVLEIVGGKPTFYENTLGVLTNSPGFEWHITNLNNYVNLAAGPIKEHKVGELMLTAFGTPRHTWRYDSTVKVRQSSLLPSYGTQDGDCQQNCHTGIPYPKQLRHSHRHTVCSGAARARYPERNAVDCGH